MDAAPQILKFPPYISQGPGGWMQPLKSEKCPPHIPQGPGGRMRPLEVRLPDSEADDAQLLVPAPR